MVGARIGTVDKVHSTPTECEGDGLGILDRSEGKRAAESSTQLGELRMTMRFPEGPCDEQNQRRWVVLGGDVHTLPSPAWVDASVLIICGDHLARILWHMTVKSSSIFPSPCRVSSGCAIFDSTCCNDRIE
jgi:hypothetical protein